MLDIDNIGDVLSPHLVAAKKKLFSLALLTRFPLCVGDSILYGFTLFSEVWYFGVYPEAGSHVSLAFPTVDEACMLLGLLCLLSAADMGMVYLIVLLVWKAKG